MYKRFLKHTIDFILSLSGLLILSPFLLSVSVVLALQNKGTPFFLQNRPGHHQKGFKIIKFKTMTDDRDEEGKLLPDNERITKLGKWIRKLSIDELPQLINVLKGDMSLIGPRPLLFKYIPLYSSKQLKRFDLRPGITGLAQINGRNAISWTEKFEFDVYYVDNVSFLLDLKILWSTVLKVVKREGVNQSQDRPMQPFDGTN